MFMTYIWESTLSAFMTKRETYVTLLCLFTHMMHVTETRILFVITERVRQNVLKIIREAVEQACRQWFGLFVENIATSWTKIHTDGIAIHFVLVSCLLPWQMTWITDIKTFYRSRALMLNGFLSFAWEKVRKIIIDCSGLGHQLFNNKQSSNTNCS